MTLSPLFPASSWMMPDTNQRFAPLMFYASTIIWSNLAVLFLAAMVTSVQLCFFVWNIEIALVDKRRLFANAHAIILITRNVVHHEHSISWYIITATCFEENIAGKRSRSATAALSSGKTILFDSMQHGHSSQQSRKVLYLPPSTSFHCTF